MGLFSGILQINRDELLIVYFGCFFFPFSTKTKMSQEICLFNSLEMFFVKIFLEPSVMLLG